MITCSVKDCSNKSRKRGWCDKHYQRWRNHGDAEKTLIRKVCSVENCLDKHFGLGYCLTHYGRVKRHGDPSVTRKASPGHSKPWKDKDGYVMVPYQKGHPNARKDGYIREHTLVMSEYLGRPLLSNENVHHKNGQRADNRIENLELWSTSQPSGQRVTDKVDWARELLGLYGTKEEQEKYGST